MHYLQNYIILKDNSIKKCILKAVPVNGGHCGSFIPQVVSCNLSLREVSSKRVVRDTRNLLTNSMILHFFTIIQPDLARSRSDGNKSSNVLKTLGPFIRRKIRRFLHRTRLK